jgi:hypothetical protein
MKITCSNFDESLEISDKDPSQIINIKCPFCNTTIELRDKPKSSPIIRLAAALIAIFVAFAFFTIKEEKVDLEFLIFGPVIAIGFMIYAIGGNRLFDKLTPQIILDALTGKRFKEKRTMQLTAIAHKLNLPFFPEGDDSLLERLNHFHLLSQGHSGRIWNMLHGETNNVE